MFWIDMYRIVADSIFLLQNFHCWIVRRMKQTTLASCWLNTPPKFTTSHIWHSLRPPFTDLKENEECHLSSVAFITVGTKRFILVVSLW